MARSPGGLVAALFGRTRRNVLALLFGQPERTFYLREIAVRSGTGMSQVQKELAQLAAAGLVLRERRANQVHFRANPAAPIYAELQAIVTKTFGVADVLKALLAPHAARLRAAFIYGSIAKGAADARSDVDLLWVGTLRPSGIAVPLAEAERRLGRRVSIVAYAPDEFARLAAERNHFLASVLQGPKIWLVGNEATLHEPVRRKPGKPRPRKAAGR